MTAPIRLLSSREAAALLNISLMQLSNLARWGEIPRYGRRRGYRFRESDLLRYVNRKTRYARPK
jgi:excisionase family DNA binding protein